MKLESEVIASEEKENEGAKTAKAIALINESIQKFKPSWVFALFSGGHDSLTASYIASMADKFDGCVHINTGIGIPATRQFVIDTCQERGWPLLEYLAVENTRADGTPDPRIYEEMVLQYGFPGPSAHQRMYANLKERQIDRLKRDHPGRKLLVGGQRQQESARRMRSTEALHIKGRTAWCAPLYDWSKGECSRLLTAGNFKRNQVCLDLGMSGECLCGAFAKPGELAALEFACPAVAKQIRDLEKKVRAAGFPWGWEDPGPPDWWQEKNQGQTFMFGYDEDETLVEEHLCTSCKWRAL